MPLHITNWKQSNVHLCSLCIVPQIFHVKRQQRINHARTTAENSILTWLVHMKHTIAQRLDCVGWLGAKHFSATSGTRRAPIPQPGDPGIVFASSVLPGTDEARSPKAAASRDRLQAGKKNRERSARRPVECREQSEGAT
jgi:hypothetical protein